jgi:hypothetical protein
MTTIILLQTTWDCIVIYLNSNFTAALRGTFAGAMATQSTANQSKLHDTLQQEIKSTNATVVVALTISNAGLTLNNHLEKGIHDSYKAQRAEDRLLE